MFEEKAPDLLCSVPDSGKLQQKLQCQWRTSGAIIRIGIPVHIAPYQVTLASHNVFEAHLTAAICEGVQVQLESPEDNTPMSHDKIGLKHSLNS